MMYIVSGLFRVAVFSFLLLLASAADADSLESLLMPGPVIQSHQEYEEKCDLCHDTSDKNRQVRLCTQCHAHENIADDLSKKSGFHGRLPAKQQNDCKHCHTEHEGRDANVILLNTSTFDHRATDFELKGLHKKTACENCHKPEKKYSDAPADCYSCHKKADVHDGKQGKKCSSCHTAAGWNKTGFDHEKTDFPLKGAHEDASCSSCHINQKYKDTPKACVSCHQINDSHRGVFGRECDDCHNSDKWDEATFDHNKKTDFSLYGKHKTTSCNSCHLSEQLPAGRTWTKKDASLPTDCFSCHKNDDSHKSRYGKKCNDCHTTSSWHKQKFDHDRETDFKLRGKHKTTACTLCHRGDLYKDELKTGCFDCHQNDDVHRGEQGKKCDSCHNEDGWHSDVAFDHDLSQFPLIGMHAATQCEECHLTTEYSTAESDCKQCHADADVHETRLGTDCATCHNPNAWNISLFDHDQGTDFKLDGAHQELGCYDCHQSSSTGKLSASKDCISCHRSKDIHNRQFGRQCGDCHSTKSFKDIDIRRLR